MKHSVQETMDPNNPCGKRAYKVESLQHPHSEIPLNISDTHLDTVGCTADLLHQWEEVSVKKGLEGYSFEDKFWISITSPQLLSRINYRTNSII